MAAVVLGQIDLNDKVIAVGRKPLKRETAETEVTW
jgi:hypothetical protein